MGSWQARRKSSCKVHSRLASLIRAVAASWGTIRSNESAVSLLSRARLVETALTALGGEAAVEAVEAVEATEVAEAAEAAEACPLTLHVTLALSPSPLLRLSSLSSSLVPGNLCSRPCCSGSS